MSNRIHVEPAEGSVTTDHRHRLAQQTANILLGNFNESRDAVQRSIIRGAPESAPVSALERVDDTDGVLATSRNLNIHNATFQQIVEPELAVNQSLDPEIEAEELPGDEGPEREQPVEVPSSSWWFTSFSKVVMLEFQDQLGTIGYTLFMGVLIFGLIFLFDHAKGLLPDPIESAKMTQVFFDCPGAFKVLFFFLHVACDFLKIVLLYTNQVREPNTQSLMLLIFIQIILELAGDLALLKDPSSECIALEEDSEKSEARLSFFMTFANLSLVHNLLISFVVFRRNSREHMLRVEEIAEEIREEERQKKLKKHQDIFDYVDRAMATQCLADEGNSHEPRSPSKRNPTCDECGICLVKFTKEDCVKIVNCGGMSAVISAHGSATSEVRRRSSIATIAVASHGLLHKFHAQCIKEWFVKKLECPLCRKSMKEDFENFRRNLQAEDPAKVPSLSPLILTRAQSMADFYENPNQSSAAAERPLGVRSDQPQLGNQSNLRIVQIGSRLNSMDEMSHEGLDSSIGAVPQDDLHEGQEDEELDDEERGQTGQVKQTEQTEQTEEENPKVSIVVEDQRQMVKIVSPRPDEEESQN